MATRGRWLLIGALSALYLAALGAIAWGIGRTLVNAKHVVALQQEIAAALPKGHPFTRVQANDFLDAAKRAESIADPLQRCLAYPDPPGSHWDRDAVVAYCKYRYQPIVTFAQAQQLIESGRAAELDKLFANALQAQTTQPDARGRFDRAFLADFDNGSFDTRSLLDAWKRQSPDSAFAYAASGLAYKAQSFDARGGDYLSNTPQNNIDSMRRLARLAESDLKRAQELNPKIVPIYIAEIGVGASTFGDAYAQDAVVHGLAVAPDDFDLYDEILWLKGPNWGGSLQEMDAVIHQAQSHAYTNPLLKMLRSKADFYRVNHCECGSARQLSAYLALLDQFARGQYLFDAGDAAHDVGDTPAMVIYTSEELRFNPDEERSRVNRIYGLVDFDRIPWAIAEADARIAKSPADEFAIKARGWAYLTESDLSHAEQDFKSATELDPTDMWALSRLGDVYLQHGRQWNKAWDVADRLIEKDPQHVNGWVLRAQIQESQPRSGLKQTADYLAAHFGKDLQLNVYIAHLQTVAEQRARAAGGRAGAPASAPQG